VRSKRSLANQRKSLLPNHTLSNSFGVRFGVRSITGKPPKKLESRSWPIPLRERWGFGAQRALTENCFDNYQANVHTRRVPDSE
jgi:hypothetical protein